MLPRLISFYLDVTSRCRLGGLITRIAELAAGLDILAAVLAQELRPLRPPAAGVLGGAAQPVVGRARPGALAGFHRRIVGPVAALVLRRRIDHTGAVAVRLRLARHPQSGQTEEQPLRAGRDMVF